MRIRVLSIGKTNIGLIKDGVDLYLKRINRHKKIDWEELPDVKNSRSLGADKLKNAEGDAFLKLVKPSDHVILLDENGKAKNSVEFAQMLQEHFNYNSKDLCFIIGGAYGFSNSMYNRANFKLTLSKMTFSHQLIRILFCEQLYRAFTIIHGEPYHHA